MNSFGFNYLARPLAASLVFLLAVQPLPARNRKGEKLLAEGRAAEDRKQYERALELYEQALSRDPSDPAYQLAARRARFQAAQAHLELGQKLRSQGDLEKALAEFQKAYAIDPASSIAEQELRRTHTMIERARKTSEVKPEERGLTPVQAARKEAEAKLANVQGVPELKPITNQLSNLKINNQPVTVLYDTVGKLAGINVVFDPDARRIQDRFTVDLTNNTLEQALDYLAVITRTFWKPLSSNTIFVTQENPTKRRDYEDQVVKVFYLQNTTSPQEITEISTALRTIVEIRRVFQYNAQNALIIRGTADQVLLAEKLIYDMDRPKAEVVVDVMVMETSQGRTRELAAALTSGSTTGLKVPIGFTPRNPILSGTTGGGSTGGGTTTGGTSGGGTTTGSTTNSGLISLAQVGRISTNDFSLTLPGALFSLVATDRRTRILQSPQVRAADSQKATLKIGDRVPIATGSFQPGIGAVGGGLSPLVSTQFNYQDVGVNVDITPKIHGTDEVSLHVEIEVSNVRDRIDLGGISQPIIGQRRIVHDVRMREGEVNMLAGLQQFQDTRSNSGLPGLVRVPFLRAILGSDSLDKSSNELLIALIPHIVRTPDIGDTNLRGVSVGTDQIVKMSVATPARPETPAGTPPAAAPAPGAVPPATPAATMPPATSGGPPRLTLVPPSITVPISAPVPMTLQIAGAADLFAAPLRIRYDKALLSLRDVTAGNFLSGDGQRATFSKNILNDVGEATITFNRPAGAGGVNGDGVILTLQFQAVGRGTTTVSVVEPGLKNSQMQPINVTAPSATVTIQ